MGNDKLNKTILLVEDEAVISLSESALIRGFGYNVIVALSGEEAVELASGNNAIDLVLMDIDLGSGIDGTSTAQKILSMRSLPIIFLTSHSEQEMVERVHGITRYGYVIKSSGDFVLQSSIEMAFELFEANRKLKNSEELFHTFYNTSFAGAAITSPEGDWIYFNDKLCEILGYTREEFKNIRWSDVLPEEDLDKDRAFFKSLKEGEKSAAVEKKYRRKNGSLVDVHVSFSTARNSDGSLVHFSSIINDITEYKKSEKIIDARIRLLEYSLDHSIDEVLQRTMDEVCAISDSGAGVYHLLGDDENTLTSKVWSAGTLQEFGYSTGTDGNSDTSGAGVWADAVRRREAVIHNDCVSLSGSKGLPSGSEAMERYLAVPVFRRGRIVAVMAVWNKPKNYTDSDIKLVSFFADLAWEIIEKKRSAQELAESEKKYRLLLDSANEAIVIVQDGVIKFMNGKTVELLGGYTPGEIQGRSFIDFIYNDDRELIIRNYTRRINGEAVETRYPFRVTIFDGSVKWVEVNAVLIEWEGRPATLNFYTDITEQRFIESELKKSALFAQATLDALSTHIAILNGNGVIIAVNRAWREFAINNSPESSSLCEGADYLSVCDSSHGENSEEAEKAAASIRSVIAGSMDEFSMEYPCHSPDEKRWFNVQFTRFAYGDAVRVVTAHENITKRKIIEGELRSLSYVVEQSPVSIVITDTEGTIQYVNPAAEQTTGYSREELVGENPRILKSDYLKPEDYELLWKTITSGKYWKGEFHNIRKDKTFYWESATISPILDENGNIDQYAAVKEDITERKNSEEKIQDLLREKELLLREVHHRIKNNMNTIRGLLLLQAADLKDSAAATALHDAESRVQSMMILYDKLYRSHDYKEISVRLYLGPLADEIMGHFPGRGKVRFKKNIEDFVLGAKIIFPLGIIVNELITNIMKYAFTGRESG